MAASESDKAAYRVRSTSPRESEGAGTRMAPHLNTNPDAGVHTSNKSHGRRGNRQGTRPHTKKGQWSEAEEMTLALHHREVGNKWAAISKSLPTRSDNDVKNHWNSTLRSKSAAKHQTFLWLYAKEVESVADNEALRQQLFELAHSRFVQLHDRDPAPPGVAVPGIGAAAGRAAGTTRRCPATPGSASARKPRRKPHRKSDSSSEYNTLSEEHSDTQHDGDSDFESGVSDGLAIPAAGGSTQLASPRTRSGRALRVVRAVSASGAHLMAADAGEEEGEKGGGDAQLMPTLQPQPQHALACASDPGMSSLRRPSCGDRGSDPVTLEQRMRAMLVEGRQVAMMHMLQERDAYMQALGGCKEEPQAELMQQQQQQAMLAQQRQAVANEIEQQQQRRAQYASGQQQQVGAGWEGAMGCFLEKDVGIKVEERDAMDVMDEIEELREMAASNPSIQDDLRALMSTPTPMFGTSPSPAPQTSVQMSDISARWLGGETATRAAPAPTYPDQAPHALAPTAAATVPVLPGLNQPSAANQTPTSLPPHNGQGQGYHSGGHGAYWAGPGAALQQHLQQQQMLIQHKQHLYQQHLLYQQQQQQQLLQQQQQRASNNGSTMRHTPTAAQLYGTHVMAANTTAAGAQPCLGALNPMAATPCSATFAAVAATREGVGRNSLGSALQGWECSMRAALQQQQQQQQRVVETECWRGGANPAHTQAMMAATMEKRESSTCASPGFAPHSAHAPPPTLRTSMPEMGDFGREFERLVGADVNTVFHKRLSSVNSCTLNTRPAKRLSSLSNTDLGSSSGFAAQPGTALSPPAVTAPVITTAAATAPTPHSAQRVVAHKPSPSPACWGAAPGGVFTAPQGLCMDAQLSTHAKETAALSAPAGAAGYDSVGAAQQAYWRRGSSTGEVGSLEGSKQGPECGHSGSSSQLTTYGLNRTEWWARAQAVAAAAPAQQAAHWSGGGGGNAHALMRASALRSSSPAAPFPVPAGVPYAIHQALAPVRAPTPVLVPSAPHLHLHPLPRSLTPQPLMVDWLSMDCLDKLDDGLELDAFPEVDEGMMMGLVGASPDIADLASGASFSDDMDALMLPLA